MARISAQGINEEVLNKFKDFVRKKHGKMHTVFGKEIETALVSHLKNNAWELKKLPHEVPVLDEVPDKLSDKLSDTDTDNNKLDKSPDEVPDPNDTPNDTVYKKLKKLFLSN